MKFVHRISIRLTSSQRSELEALAVKVPAGITLPGGGPPLVAFEVDEDHPDWSRLRMLFQQWNAGDHVTTSFSKDELEAARWLELGAWHHGYPQPDEDVFGYREATYDLTEWCEQCGMGMKQKAPFQMRGEPKWGRNSILQLIWVYDEVFVTPQVWTMVFNPHGIGCRPVMNTKHVELKTVVQLTTEEEVGIVTEGLPSEECAKCGRVKYLPVVRGAFPALKGEPSRAMVKTNEYFGSGGQADKRLLVSQAVAHSLMEVRGTWLRPVQPSNTK